jgi:hypothetical protein
MKIMCVTYIFYQKCNHWSKSYMLIFILNLSPHKSDSIAREFYEVDAHCCYDDFLSGAVVFLC